MTVAQITLVEKLCRFLNQYMDDSYCLQLLRFFGGYPYTRFSEPVIVHAVNPNNTKPHTKRALRQLVDKGVVRTSMDNDILLYSLTEDESLRNLASELAKLDWSQWQLVFRQTRPTLGQAGQSSDSQGANLENLS
jgi:hypothetical protein